MDLLDQPGVYILYREDQPYYVGQATCLYDRIWAHANRPKDRHYNFWNFFSAFVVPDKRHIDEVEGILVASMPMDNSSDFADEEDLPAGQGRHAHSISKNNSDGGKDGEEEMNKPTPADDIACPSPAEDGRAAEVALLLRLSE